MMRTSRLWGWALLLAGAGLLIVALLAVITSHNAIQSAPPVSPQAPALGGKLLVDRSGPVEITTSNLRGLGWGEIDLRTLRVSQSSQPVPVWIDGDRLRFYAEFSPTLYMTETVYWLERTGTPSPAMSEQAPQPLSGSAVNAYTATAHAKENRLYMPQVKEGDHWFWAQLTAPATKTFTITLSALADGPAHFRLETWASTEGPVNPDHHYRVAINDHLLGAFTWDGMGWHQIEADIPTGVLQNGENFVRVTAPGDTGVIADTTFVDWLAVRYPRGFVAENDRLEFDSPGGQHMLSGFSGPIDLFDITQPDQIRRTRLDQAVAFDGTPGHQYWAVGPEGYQSAQVLSTVLSPDLRADQPGADYLAIGPNELIGPLQPLLDWRAAQGLRVQAVPVEAIYDQFGAGRVTPEAIRAFLQYASRAWSTPPRYVLLVGDASYDPLGFAAPPQANRLPTFFVQTEYGGETASDWGFAQLSEDAAPSLAIGRAPARTSGQVRTFVEKTLAYERRSAPGSWQQRIVAVADGQEASFRSEAQAFLDRFPETFQKKLTNPPAGMVGANRQIVSDLEDGGLLVGYFGHGSISQWGKDSLLTTKDIAMLSNGERLPVIVNMTCLTGLFTHPKVESLAETMLWRHEGGAVAILAPTSLTLPSDQSFLSNALVDAFLKDRAARLGDWVLEARRAIQPANDGQRDVLQTFLLFGDPALKVRGE